MEFKIDDIVVETFIDEIILSRVFVQIFIDNVIDFVYVPINFNFANAPPLKS